MDAQTITMIGLVLSMAIPVTLLGVVFIKSKKKTSEKKLASLEVSFFLRVIWEHWEEKRSGKIGSSFSTIAFSGCGS